MARTKKAKAKLVVKGKRIRVTPRKWYSGAEEGTVDYGFSTRFREYPSERNEHGRLDQMRHIVYPKNKIGPWMVVREWYSYRDGMDLVTACLTQAQAKAAAEEDWAIYRAGVVPEHFMDVESAAAESRTAT